MRAGLVAREARVNLITGAAHAVPLSLAVAVIVAVLGLVAMEESWVVQAEEQRYVAMGGDVVIVEAPGAIDVRRCDALRGSSAVEASGAVRREGAVALTVLPAHDLELFSASRSWIQWHTGGAASVVAASALSDALGARLMMEGNLTPVDATFAWPEDGRRSPVGAGIVQGGLTDVADQCWVRLADPRREAPSWLTVVALASTEDANVAVTPLNPAAGGVLSAPTGGVRAYAWLLALICGAVVGWLSWRARAVEAISARAAGVPAAAHAAQSLIESLAWGTAGAALGGSILVIAAAFRWSAAAAVPLAELLPIALSAPLGASLAAALSLGWHRRRPLDNYLRARVG